MKIVEGKYNSAKVFTDRVEDSCIEQIKGLLDLEAFQGARVRIMPDCHTGAGCVIGFTADLGDKIIPNIVGVDIGCGMLTVEHHIVFTPKYRRKVIYNQLKNDIRDILKQLCSYKGVEILEGI